MFPLFYMYRILPKVIPTFLAVHVHVAQTVESTYFQQSV